MRYPLIIATMLIGCTSALDNATTTTIATRATLEHLDATWAPIYKTALADAEDAHPDDDGAYKETLAPFDRIHEGLERARQAHQLLHLAVQQWQAGDDGVTWRDLAPCALQDLRDVSTILHDAPEEVGATLAAAAHALEALTPDSQCEREPS